MRFTVLSLALALIFLSTHLCAAVELTLKSESMVKGTRLSLGDLVLHDQNEANEAAVVMAVDLGSSPPPGYTAYMTRKQIERLVRSQGLNHAITWQGPEAVRIERITRLYRGELTSQVAEQYLRQLLNDDVTRVDLTLITPIIDLQLPYGNVELKPRNMQATQAMRQRVSVWVDIVVDGNFVRTVNVPFNVNAYRSVLSAKLDLAQGTIPPCESMQLLEVDVAGLGSAQTFTECSSIQGRLKRNLASGAPLLKAQLETPFAISQGDYVALQLVNGAIYLESHAIAMANGEVGQRINVKPSISAQSVRAVIVAPGIVKVIEGGNQ